MISEPYKDYSLHQPPNLDKYALNTYRDIHDAIAVVFSQTVNSGKDVRTNRVKDECTLQLNRLTMEDQPLVEIISNVSAILYPLHQQKKDKYVDITTKINELKKLKSELHTDNERINIYSNSLID